MRRRKSVTIVAKLFASGAAKSCIPRAIRPYRNSPTSVRVILHGARCANANHVYLRKRGFETRQGLATLFDLKFPAHFAAACIHRFYYAKEISSPPKRDDAHRNTKGCHLFSLAEQLITKNLRGDFANNTVNYVRTKK